ncbi:MAG: sigma-70 family RNA polymerase sigma factor, partial [Deltaproteobacteria bacterium]|nr:sigma-70 family RNA polymerase sigma factor [Deltaproteobacteria bacterium]
SMVPMPNPIISDADLLEAWGHGDQVACQRLHDRHTEFLSRFFGNKLGRGCAELVHRTRAASINSTGRLQTPAEFRAHLSRRAYTVFKHYLRRTHRIEEQQLGSRSMQDIVPAPSNMLEENARQRRLLLALRTLPVELQVAVELHQWEGMNSAEIAVVLDVPHTIAQSRLQRGQAMLAARIGESVEAEPG